MFYRIVIDMNVDVDQLVLMVGKCSTLVATEGFHPREFYHSVKQR